MVLGDCSGGIGGTEAVVLGGLKRWYWGDCILRSLRMRRNKVTKEEVVTGTMTVGEVEHSLKLTCKPETLAIQVLYTNIVHTYIVHTYVQLA